MDHDEGDIKPLEEWEHADLALYLTPTMGRIWLI